MYSTLYIIHHIISSRPPSQIIIHIIQSSMFTPCLMFFLEFPFCLSRGKIPRCFWELPTRQVVSLATRRPPDDGRDGDWKLTSPILFMGLVRYIYLHSHRIHGTGLFTYIRLGEKWPHFFRGNVGEIFPSHGPSGIWMIFMKNKVYQNPTIKVMNPIIASGWNPL